MASPLSLLNPLVRPLPAPGRTPWLWMGAVLFLAVAGPGSAAEYKDPAGFSFRYPDEWTAVNRENVASLESAVREWLKQGEIDLTQINVIVVDPRQTDFAANCNVLQVPGELTINEATRQKLLGQAAEQFRKVGVEVENLRIDIRQFGMHEAIVLDFDSRMPFAQERLHQRQAHFPGGGKTHVVTCSAAANRFAQYEQPFDMILSSFHVPPRQSGGFDWKNIRGSATTGAIVGGIAGAVAVLIQQLRKRKTPVPASGEDAPTGGRA